MPVCAKTKLVDGSYLLELDPAITDITQCPYVVETSSNFVMSSLAQMTIDDALIISTAIALLWAGAFAIRKIAHAINFRSEEDE